MDSMRSLNTSLPKARNPAPASRPDLNQSFRTAALTVTNLYKSALAELDNSRAVGYQEALRDLIVFLDNKNFGVDDGEGWQIRQWATERLDGVLAGHSNSDSDEELDEKRARSSSPVLDRNSSPEDTRSVEPPHGESCHRSDSAPPPIHVEPSSDSDMGLPQSMFHFTSPHAYPSNNANDSSAPDVTSRRAVPPPRRTTRPNRNIQRAATSNLFSLGTLGNGAGQKRKLLQDYFNIDNLGLDDRRGGPGGNNKRGRLS